MAINAKIDLKKPVLEEISAQVEGAQCVLLVNYSGLTVAQDTQLRKELHSLVLLSSLLPKTWMAQTLSQSARTMQRLRQESSLNLQKPLRNWRWFLVL